MSYFISFNEAQSILQKTSYLPNTDFVFINLLLLGTKHKTGNRLTQKAQLQLEKEAQEKYPIPANKDQFGTIQLLKARVSRANVGNNLFLGYCNIHKLYYLDHNHTNLEIRCPVCDEKWLTEHHTQPQLKTQ